MAVLEITTEIMPHDTLPKAKVKLRAGASIVKVIPLLTSDSKNVILASGCDIKVYSISSSECIHTLKGHTSNVISLQEYKGNNLQILSCSENGIVYRWDPISGVAIKRYNMKIQHPVIAFYAPLKKYEWFVTIGKKTEVARLIGKTMKPGFTGKSSKKSVIFTAVRPDPRSVAFRVNGEFVAGVCDNKLQICILKKMKKIIHMVSKDRKLLCVACHPSDPIVATGDNKGCITVWANVLSSNQPIRSVYHWHTLPVSHLSFTSEGSHLYSGGRENALVKWNLNSGDKQVFPRLGEPIIHLAVSHENDFVVMCHSDNAVKIVNAHKQVVQVIQGLTLGHFQGLETNPGIQTGLVYDPRTMSLVLNALPGYLQFYNIQEDKPLFSLDVVCRNIQSQERNYTIINTDVEKAAFDYKGQWLATFESWDDKIVTPEWHLKFWEYRSTTQEITLNTTIDLPHSKKINCLKFRPPLANSEDSYQPMLVTTSEDRFFKIWTLGSEKSGNGYIYFWKLDSVNSYLQLPARDACFSSDGRMLAVAFDCTVTMWDLTSPFLDRPFQIHEMENPIKQVAFGNGSSKDFLVCYSDCKMMVWNVLTSSVHYNVNINIQCLAVDPNSSIMALFTQDRNLMVFSPELCKPVDTMMDVSKTPVVSAIFVPHKSPLSVPAEVSLLSWQKNSQLFFINEVQELLTVTKEIDEDDYIQNKKVILNQNIPKTPFALLQAQHKTSGEIVKGEDYDPAKSLISIEEEKIVIESYDPVALCNKIIPSLLISRKKRETIEAKEDQSPAVKESDTDSDDEEISRLVSNQKHSVVLPSNDCEPMEQDEDFFMADYSFLRDMIPIINFEGVPYEVL